MAQNGAVVVNVTPADNTNKKESKQLFGPDIGVVNNTPAWANSVGKNAAADSLSADVIKSWIAKSKEVLSYPYLYSLSNPVSALPAHDYSASTRQPQASYPPLAPTHCRTRRRP